jgi:hypothetical protein
VGNEPKPYLTFRVARKDLAMEAGRVRGILPYSELEPMPGMHPGLLGITSLQGHLIGVIDLRSKLRLLPASRGSQPKIVVLEVTTGDRPQLAGFVGTGFRTWWSTAIAICAAARCAAKAAPAGWWILTGWSPRVKWRDYGRSPLESGKGLLDFLLRFGRNRR